MKKRFDRIAASQFGKRGLAVVLCFVVLISAIGVGSALTTIVGNSENIEGSSIPAAISVVIDSAKMTGSLDYVDEGVLSKKIDTDLAGTGWGSNDKFHYSKDGGSTWNDIVVDSSTGEATITLTAKSNLRFEWVLNGTTFQLAPSGNNFTLSDFASSSYTTRFSTKNGGSSFSTDNVPAGSYTFKIYASDTDDKEVAVKNAAASYTISYNTPTNGSFTTKPTSATSGNSVTFVATPATGYTINTVTVTNNSTSVAITTTKSGNTYTFTMPSANVSVSATFKKATYTITASATYCTVSGFTSPAEYGSTVYFTVTPNNDYALKTLTVKQGSTSVSVTDGGSNSYSFTMPAGNVTITAVCATTAGTAEIYFKSATAWVYHPFITVNDGAEQEMTLGSNPQYLDNGPKSSAVKPKSDTGSLRYAWYKITLSGVDTSKPVTIKIRGNDTYMEATGTFTINAGDALYLACDNLMEGSTLVDISSLSAEARDFYDTPLNMIDG